MLGQGPTKCSIVTQRGIQVDLRIVPDECFGAAILYFTGSKDHNVKIRGLAQDLGMTLNEWGLYKLEEYNGWGYRKFHPHVKSPYLWSFSNNYTSGKYVKDGVWSNTAKSDQCGAAVILRRLAEKQSINFNNAGEPALGNTAATSGPDISTLAPLVKYGPKKFSQVAADLQAALNKLPGIFLKVDGLAGEKTSDAVKRLTGSFLEGDPRA